VQFADSSVWLDLLNDVESPEALALRTQMTTERTPIGDLVAGEVLRGLRTDSRYDSVRREFGLMSMHAMASTEIVLQAADYYRTLRSRGITVRSSIDCLIATFCIAGGHTLLHRDHDFDAFEVHFGLRVLHPRRI
jgi:predicted nucleic acid-binding protein